MLTTDAIGRKASVAVQRREIAAEHSVAKFRAPQRNQELVKRFRKAFAVDFEVRQKNQK